MEKSEKALEMRNLKYVYTKDELIEKSRELANSNRQVEELKDNKKSTMAQINSQISAQEEMVNMLTSKVGNGYQYNDVECEVNYHTPEKGMKTIVRTDIDENRSGEMDLTISEKMTEKDWMLWNDKYAKIECEIELHTPSTDQKTLTQISTGHKFIEAMTTREIEAWEEECEVKWHTPKEWYKTLIHKESGVSVERKMSPSDIEKAQQLFKFEEGKSQDAEEFESEVLIAEEVEDEY